MFQSFKKISCILLLAFVLQSSWAFSLLGPDAAYPGVPGSFGDKWEVTTINYGGPLNTVDPYQNGPKNIGEAYRHNTPVMYYACDANFLNYFGSSGSDAIDQAFAIINNSMTNNSRGNLDGYSTALTEFPLNSQAVNYQASALNLLDLKSETLQLMIEQLGLADPIRWTWCLHNRYQIPIVTPTCPFNMVYQVTMRNFDFISSPLNQIQYSPYINASLYTYFIVEDCTGPDPLSDAVEYLVDPLVNNPPVAATYEGILQTGSFYTGLTRDDMGGLRYLYTTNNIAFEFPDTNSVLLNSTQSGGTNYGAPFPLFTSDLTTFILAAKTNDPVTLSNLYPGLIITSSSATFALLKTTNYVAYFTNLIGAPAGSQTLVIVMSGVTQTIVTNYVYTFANIVTNTYHSTSTVQLVVVQAQQLNGAPAGFLTTNITVQTVTSKVPSGDFYLNTNVCGPYLILSTLATNVTTTNQIILLATNAAGLFYSQNKVTTSVTHILIAQPVVCAANSSGGGTTTNSPGLYQGIAKVQYVKTTYDSLVGQFYQPITNTYSQVLIFNSKPVKQTYQRVVFFPDMLLSAADLANGPNATAAGNARVAKNVFFDISTLTQNAGGPGVQNLAGPGTIENPQTIIFNKAGPILDNFSTAFLSQSTAIQTPFYLWGSFDGSTNAPTVYPNGTSIDDLNNLITVQITPPPPLLPNGKTGVAYPATTFTATGGAFSAPFIWSLPSGSALPAGLTLSPSGTLSGTPTKIGTYDFTIQLTDSLSRTVTWSYSITIN